MRPLPSLLSLVALGAATALSTPALAATGCNSMWAQAYADAHGITGCQDPLQTVPCDANDDGVISGPGDVCTVNELLNEFHEDPLEGELVDDPTDTDGDGLFVEYPVDIVPGGSDGNLSARVVPLCADGSASCPGEELRCVDGTRPVYYIDPADDPASTDWLITFQGGGSCGDNGSDPSDPTGGEDCWHKYTVGERGEMSTTVLDGTDNLGIKRSLNGNGILDDRTDNEFNSFHRIKVHKCSYDRSLGQVMRTHLSGTDRLPDPDTVSGKPSASVGAFNLSFHGWFIVQAILEDLRGGATVDDFAGGTTVDLSAMEDATTVLVAGHSGGSIGVVHKADAMKEILVDDWGTSMEVLALLDARAKPSLDVEVFVTDNATGSPVGDNFYDYASGAASCDSSTEQCLPAHGAVPETDYSDDVYVSGGIATSTDYREELNDASCEAAHASTGDAWRCKDPSHVMYHHMEVPFFMRQSQRDSNQLGKAPDWSDDPSYRLGTSQYVNRVVGQLLAFEDERDKAWADRDWEERVYGWAQPTNLGLGFFFPDTTKHSGLYNNTHFFDVVLTDGVDCVSYHDALWDWLNVGEQVWIDGVSGVTAGTPGVGACPP